MLTGLLNGFLIEGVEGDKDALGGEAFLDKALGGGVVVDDDGGSQSAGEVAEEASEGVFAFRVTVAVEKNGDTQETCAEESRPEAEVTGIPEQPDDIGAAGVNERPLDGVPEQGERAEALLGEAVGGKAVGFGVGEVGLTAVVHSQLDAGPAG